MRMVWQRGNLITNDACPTRRKLASTARSRSICHQWRSQKFSTGGASICSIPLKILAHPLGFTRRPITLSIHIPKNYVLSFPNRVRTPLTPLVWLRHCLSQQIPIPITPALEARLIARLPREQNKYRHLQCIFIS